MNEISAKNYLAKNGIYGLDTKKRYNEVIQWMCEFAEEENIKLKEQTKELEEVKSENMRLESLNEEMKAYMLKEGIMADFLVKGIIKEN